MYVVRKPFRNYGQVMLPGSVVESDSIKWFRTRLKDRVIIEVTAHNFNYWKDYFFTKFGVRLEDPSAKSSEETAPTSNDEPVAETVVVKATPVKAKVTVKQ